RCPRRGPPSPASSRWCRPRRCVFSAIRSSSFSSCCCSSPAVGSSSSAPATCRRRPSASKKPSPVIACRASALLAALVAAALPALAQAQGGPIRLTPPPISDPQPLGSPGAAPATPPPADATPGDATPANPPPAAAPASPAAAPAGPIVREEGAPRALDFDAVGIADPRDALPDTLWAGSRRRDIDPLL